MHRVCHFLWLRCDCCSCCILQLWLVFPFVLSFPLVVCGWLLQLFTILHGCIIFTMAASWLLPLLHLTIVVGCCGCHHCHGCFCGCWAWCWLWRLMIVAVAVVSVLFPTVPWLFPSPLFVCSVWLTGNLFSKSLILSWMLLLLLCFRILATVCCNGWLQQCCTYNNISG